MKKIKLIILIILAVTSVGILSIMKSNLSKKYSTDNANIIWEEIKIKNAQVTTFHYVILIEGKDKEILKYTQRISGDFKSSTDRKGTYFSDNGTNKISTNFIVNDTKVYSQEGENKLWYIWGLKDYPEAMYYIPTDLISVAKYIELLNKEKYFGSRLLKYSSQVDYFDSFQHSTVKYWVDDKTRFLEKVEFSGVENELNITKTITFSEYNKPVDIQAPKDDEIAK